MPPGLMMQTLGINLTYAFVIFIICLIAYFEMKEISNLSLYKGINFFRNTFLFFGIGYLIKFILALKLFGLNFGFVAEAFALALILYSTLLAGTYLVLSIGHKKLSHKLEQNVWLIYLINAFIVLVVLLTNNFLIYLIIQLIILIFGIIFLYSNGKKATMLIIYQLLLLFWIIDMLDIFVPNFFGSIQTFLYLASLGIFILILYKIIKSTHKEK